MKHISTYIYTLLFFVCVPLRFASADTSLTWLEKYPAHSLMAQNESLVLLLNQENLDTIVLDGHTGTVLASSVMNGMQGNKSVQNAQKSNVLVSYVANKDTGTLHTMDSYSFCVELNKFEVRDVSGGFELEMTLGDDSLTIDNLPKMIPVKKYNELLFPYFTSKNDKLFREQYRIVKDKYWVRVSDSGIGDLMVQYLYDLLFNKAKYTQEDLIEDNDDYGYAIKNINPHVSLLMSYVLDGSDLLIRVPVSQIKSSNPIQMIEISPYFLSAGEHDKGYLFVPDACGSLIYFNNGKTNALAYRSQVFGSDVLKGVDRYKNKTFNITFPVYGMQKNNRAVMAIIEQGAPMAELFADISGRSDEFNRISSCFILRDIENISLVGNPSITTARYCEDMYTGDIVLRYKFLSEGRSTYADMAKEYQRYLLTRGELQKKVPEQDAPFFAELMGAVRKRKFFLGIPYQSTVCATTLSQGETIYETLLAEGAKNIKLLFSGLYRGGVKNSSLQKVALEAGMGSRKDFEKLQKNVENTGGQFFPSINLGKVAGKGNFNRLSQAPRLHDGNPAGEVLFLENIMLSYWLFYPNLYVSPRSLEEYTQKAEQNLASWNIEGLAIRDLGGTLVGDYRRKQNISRIHAVPVYREVLKALAAHPLILDNPNSYALASASYVSGLPSWSNGYTILDADIPFIQLVLDGCIHYSLGAWNNKTILGSENVLLKAIETKSSPYFIFTYQKETVFHNILDNDLESTFCSYYADWVKAAVALYGEYNSFYRLVKDSPIVSHEILSAFVRRVGYENGVTVYVNYGRQKWSSGEITLSPNAYLVTKGRDAL